MTYFLINAKPYRMRFAAADYSDFINIHIAIALEAFELRTAEESVRAMAKAFRKNSHDLIT